MPIRRSAAPLALLAALALAGCTAPDPEPTPTVAPTTEPLFASEEEALAAAEEAYSAYQRAIDQIMNEGGADSAALSDHAVPEVIEFQSGGFDQLRTSGWRSTGATQLDSWTIQNFTADGSSVTFYVCKDVSDVDVMDEMGRSVVSQDRPDRAAVEVTLIMNDEKLLVAEESVWSRGLPGC